jgi:hypothetical protein
MTKTVAAMAAPHQNAKNVHAPLFREKITHRTRQDARHVRPLASAIPIFNHRRHLMKTAVIALTILFFATPALPADREPCIVQLHSAISPSLIIVTVECHAIATEVSLYQNDALIQKITLPPPLNQRGDPLYFIVSPVPGINSFYAASNDVLPENDGTLSQPPQ